MKRIFIKKLSLLKCFSYFYSNIYENHPTKQFDGLSWTVKSLLCVCNITYQQVLSTRHGKILFVVIVYMIHLLERKTSMTFKRDINDDNYDSACDSNYYKITIRLYSLYSLHFWLNQHVKMDDWIFLTKWCNI